MNEASLGCVLLTETAYGVDESADRRVVDFEITRARTRKGTKYV